MILCWFFSLFFLWCSHINQKTQFENPVVEAKKKLAQEAAAAAQCQKGAASAPGKHPLSHTVKYKPTVSECKKKWKMYFFFIIYLQVKRNPVGKMLNVIIFNNTTVQNIRSNQQRNIFEKTQKQQLHSLLCSSLHAYDVYWWHSAQSVWNFFNGSLSPCIAIFIP